MRTTPSFVTFGVPQCAESGSPYLITPARLQQGPGTRFQRNGNGKA